jgi:tetratricopeptide (TPR) repeat protein
MIRASSALFLLLLTGSAAAKPTPFERAYEAGQDAYHLGRLDEAAAHFARARDLAPDKPGPWRWLGRTDRARKRWDECLEASIRALRIAPRSPHAAEIRLDVEACRAGLGRPPYPGKLGPEQGAIHVPQADFRVVVDGISRGAPPIVFPINAGLHTVELVPAVANGPSKVQLSVDVVPGVVHDVIPIH